MSAAPKKTTSLTTAQLKLLLAHIGSATSGLKSALLSRLGGAVQTPLLPMSRKPSKGTVGNSNSENSSQPNRTRGNPTRVLSIDMGIRNLAYCIADIRLLDSKKNNWSLDIVDWKRIDVMSKYQDASTPGKEVKSLISDGSESTEAFSPARLAPAAVHLAKNMFLPTIPDLIAIERQRFRSGGGSAVLEWTLRVNMLESMLWTAFTSIAGTHQLVGVSPARVARFWVPKAAGTKSTVEKSEKVKVIRTWLAGKNPSGMKITTSGDAQETKEKVLTGRVRGADKVDDLADCLLQAAALTMWERNRRTLMDIGMDTGKLFHYCSIVNSDPNSDEPG